LIAFFLSKFVGFELKPSWHLYFNETIVADACYRVSISVTDLYAFAVDEAFAFSVISGLAQNQAC
jgi:hypothetical protein